MTDLFSALTPDIAILADAASATVTRLPADAIRHRKESRNDNSDNQTDIIRCHHIAANMDVPEVA